MQLLIGLIVIIGIVIWSIIWLVRKLFGMGSSSRTSLPSQTSLPPQRNGSMFRVQCTSKSEPLPENPNQSTELISVSIIGGQVLLPHNNCPVIGIVRISDITEGDFQPILCFPQELADDDGLFSYDFNINMPYSRTVFDIIEVINIPMKALKAPKKGLRTLKVLVAIVSPDSREHVYAEGWADISFMQQTYGWKEYNEEAAGWDSKLAALAISFATVGGDFGKTEALIIKKYFNELHSNFSDVNAIDFRKQKINESIEETLTKIKNQQIQPSQNIDLVCDEIHREDTSILPQQAFELCVRIACADEKIDQREEELLEYVAEKLKLPTEFIRETRDRYISVTMHQHNGEMSGYEMLGMPSNFTQQEQLEWINKEYRKWRTRVTNNDEKVSAEASIRLDLLSKLRTELNAEA